MSHTSLSGAVENLKKMVGGSTSDYISIDDLYRNVGRNIGNSRDKSWLYNRLSAMRSYELFKKEYEVRNGTQVLKGLRLTHKGREAIRIQAIVPLQSPSHKPSVNHEVTIGSWKADAEILQKLYPELEVIYDIRLRKTEA